MASSSPLTELLDSSPPKYLISMDKESSGLEDTPTRLCFYASQPSLRGGGPIGLLRSRYHTLPAVPAYQRPLAPNSSPQSSIFGGTPIRGTRQEQLAIIQKAGIQKRQDNKQQTKNTQPTSEASDEADSEHHCLFAILDKLSGNGVIFGKLVEHFFDPWNGLHNKQWEEFFQNQEQVPKILDWWAAPSNSATGWASVHNWAVDYVEKAVAREA
ncbi:hypothetical protein FA15DRAFT_710658 [Coprinopsis marcescibilis]|uniref:Uncharacterized protein n=1 Tax=Coprinopsis marcescibilis TaxID=230819 RepID=A0A5C3KCU8_COPMA|nr:hypothetical protein FA15DRAFT_710658 [Coprinopsis marcescibilis]